MEISLSLHNAWEYDKQKKVIKDPLVMKTKALQCIHLQERENWKKITKNEKKKKKNTHTPKLEIGIWVRKNCIPKW